MSKFSNLNLQTSDDARKIAKRRLPKMAFDYFDGAALTEYGEYISGPKIIDDKTKDRMKEVLKDIQSGKFTKLWMDENKIGQKNFLRMRKELSEHPIEKVGEKLRAMMPWIGKNKLVDKSKN